MSKILYSLTDEHRAQMKPWADKWIANAMSTAPMTYEERDICRKAVNGMYAAAKLQPPTCIAFAAGPITGSLAAGIAAGVWHLRNHPELHVRLFGRHVSAAEIDASARTACTIASRAARGLQVRLPEVVATRNATSDATSDATDAATRNVTDEATYAATRNATHDATDGATRNATYAATDEATDEATDAATRNATDAATRGATHNATYNATSDATDGATRNATHDATDGATRNATSDATDAATRNVTDEATYGATRNATYAATRDATSDATSDATDAATRNVTDEATYAATSDATSDATDAATRNVTDEATYAATRNATDAATRGATPIVRFLLLCVGRHWRGRNGGNQWSGWVTFLSFFRHVVQLPIDYSAWDHYEQLAIHGGPRWVFADFTIIADRPTKLSVDERNRPHCGDGPSHMWRDGTKLYYWHGVKVSERLIERPESYTRDEILAETNSEVVRALAERLGWEKFLRVIGARVLDVWVDPGTGLKYELLDMNHSFGEAQPRLLRMQSPALNDGSQPSYIETVDGRLATAKAARRWKFCNADGSWPSADECNANPAVSFEAEK